ncbi:MAG: ABC transporter ATP-binding protein [Holosporales bacterium]
MKTSDLAIDVKGLVTQIGSTLLHDHLQLQVPRGQIYGLVGASGSGKSVFVNTLLGLRRMQGGKIRLLGQEANTPQQMQALRARIGVLFQSGALYSSLTVSENIQMPMREIAKIPQSLAEELALSRLMMVGLKPEDALKYPSELSGGMIKRVGLARALAIDAELLFLDEPTAGLDPVSAEAFDSLLKRLQSSLKLTVLMVTHDLDSLVSVCDRVAVLVDRHIIVGTLEELRAHSHPWIKSYFSGARGRACLGNKG